MTNEMIIMNVQFVLLEEGKIRGTGRMMTVVDADGNEKSVEEPEAIHTYETWKKLGYQVRRGEKAIAPIEIWKPKTRKKEEEEKDAVPSLMKPQMFRKVAHFFAAHQVDPIKAGA